MDVNQIFFQTGSHRPAALQLNYRCSRGVMRIPGRLIRLAVGNETEHTYMDGAVRVHILYFKRIPKSIKNDSWFCENCKCVIWGSVVQARQAPSIFFFIGVEAYPKSWQKISPFFYLQTLNTREGDAGNSHYKMLYIYVKLSFSLCILTCRVPKMWVGQSSPHFSTCKFNKKVSVINLKKKGGGMPARILISEKFKHHC